MINAKNYVFTRYRKINSDYMNNSIKTATIAAICNAKIGILNSLIKVLTFGIGGYFVIKGNLSLGGMTIFISYSGMIIQPIQAIMKSILPVQESIVSLEKIYAILDIAIVKSNNIISLDDMKRSIEFKNVTFRYGDKKVLDDFNLNIRANKVVGIVAKSGQGKTTLIKILFRLWDIDKGQVLLNGNDITQFNIDYLRNNISVVNQDITLYNDTVYNNIILDKYKISKGQLKKILKQLGLYDFIECLPQKINTVIGEDGVKLSGGQKQKIAIARAIIKDAPIVIFDEATSSLDNIAERFIQNNIKKFIKEKTVLIIAHRLSTLIYCDKIFVIDKGKVVENGTHEELLMRKGLYYNLYFSNTEE